MNQPVIIGYDESPSSQRALAEAAREAVWRGTGLTVIHAFPSASRQAGDSPDRSSRAVAEKLAEAAADAVGRDHPGLHVQGLAVAGAPAAVLAEAARNAALLVVGSRGRGGFAGQLLGSVSLRVLASARCPVIVVRDQPHPVRDRVLAALDIDEPCDALLDFAFATAARRGAQLVALNVWDTPWLTAYAQGAGFYENDDAHHADRKARMNKLLEPWRAGYPQVSVTEFMRVGTTGAIVVNTSARADLLAVGAGRRGTRLGPVAHTALLHAHCPIAVVPRTDSA